MPFIGRDWRSPGEAWVKTETLGWQRMKLIESHLHPSCFQTHPACSWPPRSQFGQHMAANCNKTVDCDTTQQQPTTDSISRSGGSLSSGTNSSQESSPTNSASTSPTGSPDKQAGHNHFHPITVSSPYGQYSCYLHHHHNHHHLHHHRHPQQQQQQQRYNEQHQNASRPNSVAEHCYNCEMKHMATVKDISQQHNAQSKQFSSSLSRESTINKMRHNNSISDFESHARSTNDQTNFATCMGSCPSSPQKLSNNSLDNQGNCSSSILSNDIKIQDKESTSTDTTDLVNESTNVKSDNDHISQPTCATCYCDDNLCCQQNRSREPHPKTAPYCRISVRTREVAMYNTMSEAFYRLDFCNAIHDIRRFNYICKLLHLLITQNLTSLSGCATKILFTMLEQVAWEVASNKRNIHVLKNLLNELKQMIQKYYCWGRPIGSSILWQQHFDTIERIGQIVDGIELSPPKNNCDQVTFDKLPYEMIREILLRLNDYRDLVNSAQASPVMQTMINNQYIWQRLCRYHFTEQQLKMAFENRDGTFVNGKKSSLRGVKYARTTSADGRSSYRNPVARKSKGCLTTRQQIEQTSARRAPRISNTGQPASSPSSSSSSSSPQPTSSSSYVTKAIRIFDKKGTSMNIGSAQVRNERERQNHGNVSDTQPNHNDLNEETQPSTTRPMTANLPNHEIDWERVFHQLRKKFDLKEEYADCLQLCRHCRCLFWKSIGHPCIKNEDSDEELFRLDQPTYSMSNDCDDYRRSASADQLPSSSSRQDNDQSNHRNRLSVALLSRNFDNRARSASSNPEAENVDPQTGRQRHTVRVHNNNNDGRHDQRTSSQRRNENLNESLQERRARILNQRYDRENNNNDNNNNIALANRRDELVPKHVTITPQAFLKFFSL